MNKKEFIELVKETGDYKTTVEAAKAVNSFTTAVTQALSQRENIHIVGFGNFKTRVQKARKGKLPRGNKTFQTKDKIVPSFLASQKLKDTIK